MPVSSHTRPKSAPTESIVRIINPVKNESHISTVANASPSTAMPILFAQSAPVVAFLTSCSPNVSKLYLFPAVLCDSL